MPTAVVWPRPSRRRLEHRLIGQRAGARDDADRCRGMKILPGMMPILHSPAVTTPGQFGPIRRDFEPESARFTRIMSCTGMPSVMADDQRDFGVDRLADRVGRARRRHIDDGGLGAGLLAGLGHRVEDRQAEMRACRPCRARRRRPSWCHRRSPARNGTCRSCR